MAHGSQSTLVKERSSHLVSLKETYFDGVRDVMMCNMSGLVAARMREEMKLIGPARVNKFQ